VVRRIGDQRPQAGKFVNRILALRPFQKITVASEGILLSAGALGISADVMELVDSILMCAPVFQRNRNPAADIDRFPPQKTIVMRGRL
jgi:hypothetical protein